MSHSNEPPALPVVVIDEAGDTPNWVPLVGLALLVVVALLIAMRQALGIGVPAEPPAKTQTADTAPQAAEAKPAEAKPAE